MAIGSSHMTSPAAICKGFVTASLLKSYGHQIKSLCFITQLSLHAMSYINSKFLLSATCSNLREIFSSFHWIYISLGSSFGKSRKSLSNTTLSPRGPTAAPTPILYKWPPRAVSDVSEKTLSQSVSQSHSVHTSVADPGYSQGSGQNVIWPQCLLNFRAPSLQNKINFMNSHR